MTARAGRILDGNRCTSAHLGRRIGYRLIETQYPSTGAAFRPKRPGEARQCGGFAAFAPASNEYVVAVTGSFTGPTDTSVIVTAGGGHSKLATVTGNSFTATVVVVPGVNTIEVGVARRDGTTDLASRTFTAVLSPLVVLTSPIQCAPLPVPANITFAADALSPGGAIAKVEFSEQGVIVGTATAPPYTYAHTLTQVGSRSLAATATDTTGQTANSAVTVSCTSAPPTVALTSPASQRRSCLRLPGFGLPRYGLPPCGCRTFTGALIPALAGIHFSSPDRDLRSAQPLRLIAEMIDGG